MRFQKTYDTFKRDQRRSFSTSNGDPPLKTGIALAILSKDIGKVPDEK